MINFKVFILIIYKVIIFMLSISQRLIKNVLIIKSNK